MRKKFPEWPIYFHTDPHSIVTLEILLIFVLVLVRENRWKIEDEDDRNVTQTASQWAGGRAGLGWG